MQHLFEFASGSVAGKDHRREGKNNHDSFYIRVNDQSLIAIVADGCGSGKHSEVGAKIGLRLLVANLAARLQDFSYKPVMPMLERARQDTLLNLRILTNNMCVNFSGSFSKTVEDYFLFTVVGAILTETESVFFSIGDGVLMINGEIIEIGPFSGNEPPYLAYGLVETSLTEEDPLAIRFKEWRRMDTIDLQSFLLGTDGVTHFIRAAEINLPGKTEKVGPLSQFLTEDRYFVNPDNIRRRLALTNMEYAIPDWDMKRILVQNGHLPDDTTLVVGRRKGNTL